MKRILILLLCLVIGLSSCDVIEVILEEEFGYYEPADDYYGGTESDEALLKVWYIDVGQGDSIFIESPEGKTMLIDCGEYENIKSVTDFLDAHSIDTIDVVIATHPHTDHMGGMATIFWNYDIKSVYMPKATSNTVSFEKLVEAIRDEGLKIKEAKAGISIDFGDVEAEILAPCSGAYESLNNYSAVIKISYKDVSYLFTGDAEVLSENEILESGADISADVLKVGHHGSNSSTSKNFLKAVNPSCAVICVGKDNSYGHPKEKILDRLGDIPVYRTDYNGTILVYTDGTKLFGPEGEIGISDKNTAKTVFVSPSGTKYHKAGCKYITEDCEEITETMALAEGYEPCSRCFG